MQTLPEIYTWIKVGYVEFLQDVITCQAVREDVFNEMRNETSLPTHQTKQKVSIDTTELSKKMTNDWFYFYLPSLFWLSHVNYQQLLKPKI